MYVCIRLNRNGKTNMRNWLDRQNDNDCFAHVFFLSTFPWKIIFCFFLFLLEMQFSPMINGFWCFSHFAWTHRVFSVAVFFYFVYFFHSYSVSLFKSGKTESFQWKCKFTLANTHNLLLFTLVYRFLCCFFFLLFYSTSMNGIHVCHRFCVKKKT